MKILSQHFTGSTHDKGSRMKRLLSLHFYNFSSSVTTPPRHSFVISLIRRCNTLFEYVSPSVLEHGWDLTGKSFSDIFSQVEIITV